MAAMQNQASLFAPAGGTFLGGQPWMPPMAQEKQPLLPRSSAPARASAGGLFCLALPVEVRVALIPWAIFAVTTLAFTFSYHHCPGFLLLLLLSGVIAGIVASMQRLAYVLPPSLLGHLPSFLTSALGPRAAIGQHGDLPAEVVTQKRKELRLILVSTLAMVVGAGVGHYIYCSSIQDYWMYFERQHYSDVRPNEAAAAHRDASVIIFAAGSKPNAARSVAFDAGNNLYCVAPIQMNGYNASAVTSNVVEYWAVGRDCCTDQPRAFTCGDINVAAANGGIVVHDRSQLIYGKSVSGDLRLYSRAARQAAAKYGLVTAKKPLFLLWSADLAATNRQHLLDAWILVLEMVILGLPVFVLLELGSASTTQLISRFRKRNTNVGREASPMSPEALLAVAKAAGVQPPPPAVMAAMSAAVPAMGGLPLSGAFNSKGSTWKSSAPLKPPA